MLLMPKSAGDQGNNNNTKCNRVIKKKLNNNLVHINFRIMLIINLKIP